MQVSLYIIILLVCVESAKFKLIPQVLYHGLLITWGIIDIVISYNLQLRPLLTVADDEPSSDNRQLAVVSTSTNETILANDDKSTFTDKDDDSFGSPGSPPSSVDESDYEMAIGSGDVNSEIETL